MLRVELYKAFHNKRFWIALVLGMLIVIAESIFITRLIRTSYLELKPENGKLYYYSPEISFILSWIGGDPGSMFSLMYYNFLLPLLAAIPFAGSGCDERNMQYDQIVICRSGKMSYLFSKYVACFLSGGIVITIPPLVSLLYAMSWLPLIPLEASANQSYVSIHSLWGNLFYQCPVVYAFLYIILDFVIGGLFSCLSLSLTYIIKRRFVALYLPMIVNMLLMELFNLSPGIWQIVSRLIPYCYVHPGAYADVPGRLVFISLIIMFTISGCLYFIPGVVRDVID